MFVSDFIKFIKKPPEIPTDFLLKSFPYKPLTASDLPQSLIKEIADARMDIRLHVVEHMLGIED